MTSPLPPPANALLGSLVADAVSMPVHWYYDRVALDRDYGRIDGYAAPKSPHPDSILWRSSYTPLNAKGDILREQAQYWGRRGVHYHQFLAAGENTLNQRLAIELAAMARAKGSDPAAWAERYIALVLEPGWHRDTYVEECHRIFFTNHARGTKPTACGGRDVHIGGLVPVPALVAALFGSLTPAELRKAVQAHVSLTHKDPGVLAAADALVRMLVRVCGGEDLREAILAEGGEWVSNAKMRQWDAMPEREVIGRVLSPACYIPDAFPAALHLAWRHAGDFAGGVFANATVGGDNCHRGAVVGSLLGATCEIPPSLVSGLAAAPRVLDLFGPARAAPGEEAKR